MKPKSLFNITTFHSKLYPTYTSKYLFLANKECFDIFLFTNNSSHTQIFKQTVGQRKISLLHTSSYTTITYYNAIISNVDITWKCILQH